MAVKNRRHAIYRKAALVLGAAIFCISSANIEHVNAQAIEKSLGTPIPDDAKLLLTANELIYDRDANKVVAVGGVQLNYGGYKLVAKRVEYDQKSGRMVAIGDIEMVEPGGNRVYGDRIDVTDDFANGFIDAIRIESTDDTRLVAIKGRRVNATEMILEKGVYTACQPCLEHPEKPPLWQVKAERVIQNGVTHTIRLEKARFELFGTPIAYIPVLEMPDPTVKRKSGFLFPTMSTSQKLGFGLSIPYYQTITPQMDATLTVTGYTSQGPLIDAEFRQRFSGGLHTFHIAGIDQLHPELFTSDTSDYRVKQRYGASSKGDFYINPRWAFGWDVMVQSDNNFARTYKLFDADNETHTNQVYLTGLGNRNYFDLRSYYFDVQDADPNNSDERKQAIVHPVLDYSYIHPEPVAGGQLKANFNLTSLSRNKSDVYSRLQGIDVGDRYRGLEGTTSRFTSELEWERTFITPFGLELTPLLAARGDGFMLDNNGVPGTYAGDFYNGNNASRYLLTAGLEARYPVLITTDNSTHIIEPIAQVYARNNEQMAGRLPNEDAQSFVFDATNLFSRDKFSGYDREEGGTRANVGIRYTGSFDNGYTLRGVFGQSFQLAGKNSFAAHDLINVGANSGLETTRSDYVGSVGVSVPNGMSVSFGGRFDEKSLKLQRADTTLGYNSNWLQSEITYSRIAAQPDYGYPKDGDEIQSTSAVKLNDRWSLYGSMTWDMNYNVLTRRGVGFAYDDSCTVFSLAFNEKRDIGDTNASDWEIGARLTFRTLGDVNLGNATVPKFQ